MNQNENRRSRRAGRVAAWLIEPLAPDVAKNIERLSRIDDIERIALMPDVHLADGVCIGTVVAARTSIYPEAVGGDIGCGMAALTFAGSRPVLDERIAEQLLHSLRRAVPSIKHARREALPAELATFTLSSPTLQRLLERDGAAELGTLGRGNHFLELQIDDREQVWIMVHSGSRVLGPAIREHHLKNAHTVGSGPCALGADTDAGRAYLADHNVALKYAAINRELILARAVEIVTEVTGLEPDWASSITCPHNFVRREEHADRELWVHRKGAISARESELGLIPGSMGTESYVVSGRGCAESLASSSHGAGRAMNRTLARNRIGTAQLEREMRGVWFDGALSERLCDEAPSAYKPIGAVMRAQKPLTRIVRRLLPVLVYKGG